MDTTLDSYEGLTFTSSTLGLRSTQHNMYALALSVLLGLAVSDYMEGHGMGWVAWLFEVAALFALVHYMRGQVTRKILRTSVTLARDGVEIQDTTERVSIPRRDLMYIYINRSASGHRRKVYFESRRGRLYTLLDPDQGESLEAWALNVAQAAGVRIKLRNRFYLNAEPLWAFLAGCAIMSSIVALVSYFGL